jgi:hypothetical protein
LENPLPLARKYLARAAQDGRRLLAARNAVLWPNLERLPLGFDPAAASKIAVLDLWFMRVGFYRGVVGLEAS